MAVAKLFEILYRLGFLAPRTFRRLLSAIFLDGINIMLLLSMGAYKYGEKVAIVFGEETLSYKQLKSRSESLAFAFSDTYKLGEGKKAAFLCRNHPVLIQSIFAASRTGANLYLLNPEMSQWQFDKLVTANNFDMLIYDTEFENLISHSAYADVKLLSYQEHGLSADQLARNSFRQEKRLKKAGSSRIILLTGGTTGQPKKAQHKPSLFNFLHPFSAILIQLNLKKYQAAYIATPIFHGYGIAFLLSLLALGKKVVIQERFHAKTACALVEKHKVEVITVVPLMIDKMLKTSPAQLKTLKCIASGGAQLNPQLAKDITGFLGEVLYNLYGTSEAGLNLIATPEDLVCRATTIGKSINGTKMTVIENGKPKKPGEIGQLCIRNNWSMKNRKKGWIETGDLGYRDTEGYYYLCGRTDDMIISAGINIYPAEIEHALLSHPLVEDAAVIGVEDTAYGEAVKAFIQARPGAGLSQEELVGWLEPLVAKFQIPRSVEFVEYLPYTAIGKLDKKLLRKKGSI